MTRFNKSKYLIIGCTLLFLFSCNNDDGETCNDPDACTEFTSPDGSCVYICLTDAEKARVTDFVASAVSFIESNGQEDAFQSFESETDGFIDEELYIFVLDMEANMLSHGFQPELIDQNVYDLQDVNGKYLIQDLLNIINESGQGWTWYQWDDPVTNTIRKKFTFAQRTGDLIIASGTYK